MFERDKVAGFTQEDCENKLTFIAFFLRYQKDPQLIVRFKLYKYRVERQLNLLNKNTLAFYLLTIRASELLIEI